MKTVCLALIAAVFALPAFAQEAEPESIGAQIGRLYRSFTTDAPETPARDFVTRSRPANLDYRPFQPTRANPADVDRHVAHARAIAADVEASGASARRRAARVAIPDAPPPKTRGR